MYHVGLRVDVDTLRGTRKGVANLVDLLERHRIWATFFFSVGPDNMGRHLWRLLRPRFLAKMLRTRAAGLYGWDILMRGTLWPGPEIGKLCPDAIRKTAEAGHETGLHAWDHHRWQTRIEHMDPKAISDEIQKGYDRLTQLTGRPPDGFAAPAWRMTPEILDVLEPFSFRFHSDCRGKSLFCPVNGTRRFHHIQVPNTLPTFDEAVGRTCTAENYNEYLLSLIRPGQLNVLTIHAEVEGIRCLDMFHDFLHKAFQKHITFGPLGKLLDQTPKIGESGIEQGTVPGRDGYLALQGGMIRDAEDSRQKIKYGANERVAS